eukprot:GHUV01058156.1.p1 GENE.GHUV01058156.1~~GHUV01058156.1.p1  ORF type:complete len:134 (-),score=11.90 GHUV01058156.1:79-480(-)
MMLRITLVSCQNSYTYWHPSMHRRQAMPVPQVSVLSPAAASVSCHWLLLPCPQLIKSGERDRLKQLLREKLTECGWRDEVKQRCRGKLHIMYNTVLLVTVVALNLEIIRVNPSPGHWALKLCIARPNFRHSCR